MQVKAQLKLSDAPFVIDLNQFLPEGAPRGGTWNFSDPEERHRRQIRNGLFVSAKGMLYHNTPSVAAMPTVMVDRTPGFGYLSSTPDVGGDTVLDMDYEESEPGLELADGKVYKSFWELMNSTYWLQNYQSQEMVILVRPGTYYNVIGEFHWTPAQRLTIRAKDPAKRPKFVKRFKVNGMERSGGILQVRNDAKAYPDAMFRMEHIILDGGVSIMDPGSAAILCMFGNHVRAKVLGCQFRRGNNGPVNYPDRRPSGDDAGYYQSEFDFLKCDFIDCGNSSAGYASATHGLYITHSKRLLVDQCRFVATDARRVTEAFDVPGGHMAKIGAYDTVVRNSVFDNRVGAYTTCIEFPYGGRLTVDDNVMISGDNMTGAGGAGAGHIQALNEWAAHGIMRKDIDILLVGNVHVHKGTKTMFDWRYRSKQITDPATGQVYRTEDFIKSVVHDRNVYFGPGFINRLGNFVV